MDVSCCEMKNQGRAIILLYKYMKERKKGPAVEEERETNELKEDL